MNAFSNEFDSGYLTTLFNLNRSIHQLNLGPDRWLAETVPYLLRSPDGVDGSYVLICISGLNDGDIHENLCFLFPVVSLLGESPSESTSIVNVGGQVAITLPNLLLAEGQRSSDCMDNFYRFWEPLKKALCEVKHDIPDRHASLASAATNSHPPADASLIDYVSGILGSKAFLQEAIDGAVSPLTSNLIMDVFRMERGREVAPLRVIDTSTTNGKGSTNG